MPSRRPINRRWDESRRIIFSPGERKPGRDFLLLHKSNVGGSDASDGRRRYATRQLRSSDLPSRESAKKPDPITEAYRTSTQTIAKGSKHLTDPNQLMRALEGKNRELEHVKNQLAKLGEDHKMQIDGMQKLLCEEKDREIAKITQKYEQLEQGLRSDHNQEMQKLHETESCLRDRSSQLGVREAAILQERKDLDTTIAKAKCDAEAAANMRVESAISAAESSKQRNDSKHADLIQKHNDRESRRDEEMSALQVKQSEQMEQRQKDHERALQIEFQQERKSFADGLSSAIQDARTAGLHRETVERATYTAYQEIWNELRLACSPVRDDMRYVRETLIERWKYWTKASAESDLGKVDRWLPHTRPQLFKKLQEYVRDRADQVNNTLRQLDDFTDAFDLARAEVMTGAHTSRRLTKHMHYHLYQDKYEDSSILNFMLNDNEIRKDRLQIRRELERYRVMLGGRMDPTTRRRAEREERVLIRSTVISKSILEYFTRLRECEALKALATDSEIAKDVYLKTQKALVQVHEARRRWKEVIDSPVRNIASSQHRSEYVKMERDARARIGEFRGMIQKRRQLQAHLGNDPGDKAQLDASISAELAAVEERKREILRNITFGGSSLVNLSERSRQTVPHVTRPVSRRVRRRTSSALEQRKSRARSVETPVNAKREPGSLDYATKTEQETRELEEHLARAKVDAIRNTHNALIQRKAGLTGKDPAEAAMLDTELSNTNKALSRSLETVSALESGAPVAALVAQGRLGSSKFRRQALKAASSGSSISSDGPATLPFSPVRSIISLRGGARSALIPTSAQQAPYTYWAATRSSHSMPHNVRFHSRLTGFTPDCVDAVVVRATTSASIHDDTSPAWATCDNSYDHECLPGRTVHAKIDLSHQTGESSEDECQPLSESGSSQQSLQAPIASYSSLSLVSGMQAPHLSEVSLGTDGMGRTMRETELTYHISAADYRNAVLASQSTSAAFWSLKLYKNANGKQPVVYYCTNYEKTEERAKEFLSETVLGFDIEWEMYASISKSSIKDNVSLIQIASEDKVGLFQIALFRGDSVEQLVPPSLRAILESRDIIKAGVNVRGDARRLEQCLNVEMAGLFELSHLYRVVKFSETAPQHVNKKLVSMADQVQNVLLLPLKKDAVRTSAWSKKLDAQQSEYAASDAYAGFRLYHALDAKRRKMSPEPPPPACLEDGAPLQYWKDGVLVSKTYVVKRAEKVSEQGEKLGDAEEDEEYFDAVENFGEQNAESLDSNRPSALVVEAPAAPTAQPLYPDLPSLESLSITDAADPQSATAPSTSLDRAARKPQPPSTPELARADSWITTFRTTRALKTGPSPLRAYHLWHQQNFDCAEVATFLRDPPLAVQTIANYVMQAVKDEGLPYDAERLREGPLGILPKSVHGRYAKVLRGLEGR